MPPFAQTNIQLYRQMLASPSYTDADVALAATAYETARPLFVGLFRGSGKTLTAHLVGTASILVALDRDATVIAAALLHAALADGDFGPHAGDDDKRERLAGVGDEVLALLQAYDDLGWSYDDRTVRSIRGRLGAMSDRYREAVRLRIANELEDLLDTGILFCGDVVDDVTQRKSAEWRLAYLDEHGPSLVELAEELGDHTLAGWLEAAARENREARIPAELRTGSVAMHRITPASYRVRPDRRAVVRAVSRARELGAGATLTVAARRVRRAVRRRRR